MIFKCQTDIVATSQPLYLLNLRVERIHNHYIYYIWRAFNSQTIIFKAVGAFEHAYHDLARFQLANHCPGYVETFDLHMFSDVVLSGSASETCFIYIHIYIYKYIYIYIYIYIHILHLACNWVFSSRKQLFVKHLKRFQLANDYNG